MFIYSRLGADTLKQLPRLKMIATRSTGFDHIDLDYCERNGITVANVPTYGENTATEHVFALMLALSHWLVEATDRTRRGDFTPEGLQGFDLRGRTPGGDRHRQYRPAHHPDRPRLRHAGAGL